MPELQSAVRALSGVGAAAIRWPEPQGPATLRIELEPSADRETVTASVLDTLDRIVGADLSSLHVALPPPPRAPSGEEPAESGDVLVRGTTTVEAPASSNGHAAERPVFEGIIVQRSALDVAVTVTLTYRGCRLTGEAQGLATRRATARVAAAATLSALRDLFGDDVRLQVDWIEVHDADHPVRPAVAQVAVAVLSGTGEQVMVGSALVRDDVRESAVRATLDALNRWLTRPEVAG